ncbi:hypothetical protein L2E82_06537 [Cichorium intybus]|uniref:Uncharacterized protein n=1 Tax=Cichorium intybus TaxID=13427 RepID=A0ACB9HBT5_CICIN|nr:hypothetical protein L2E82_06537 [Cichorium intybus]
MGSAIFTLFLLFVSIKVPFNLELPPTGSLFRIRGIELSVSLIVCIFSSISLSTQIFWIVNFILIVCSSAWDDFVFSLIKWCFRCLSQILDAIPMLEFLCIYNHGREAVVDEQEELSWEPDEQFVVVNVYDQVEYD